MESRIPLDNAVTGVLQLLRCLFQGSCYRGGWSADAIIPQDGDFELRIRLC